MTRDSTRKVSVVLLCGGTADGPWYGGMPVWAYPTPIQRRRDVIIVSSKGDKYPIQIRCPNSAETRAGSRYFWLKI